MSKTTPHLPILTIIALLLMIGCSSPYQSPVAEIDEPRFLDSDRIHRVNSGETLYAIAWIYDLDFLHIARVNNLTSPYTIFPGQILNVDPRAVASPQTRSNTASASPPTTRTREVTRSTSIQTRSPVSNSSSNPATAPAVTGTSGRPAATSSVQVNPVVVRQGPVNWAWPAQGNIIGRFSETGVETKGINIAGKTGDPVSAAGDGEVVYAGRGLLGYGDLIIIKHNDRFLSAYAHNSAMLVNEGDKVSRGQKIAELGSTGVDTEMLHFEIRLEGKPVDPLAYLPSRS